MTYRDVTVFRIGAAMLACGVVAGCVAGISADKSSVPVQDAASPVTVRQAYVGDMYVYEGLTYHVFPRNGKAASAMMLLPFPHRLTETPGPDSPFLIGVALKALKPGYSFDPMSVKYWTDETHYVSPSSMIGPNDCASTKGSASVHPVTALALEPNSCSYLWVQLDAPRPDPARSFKISLSAIRDGQDFELPPVQFHEKTHKGVFAMP